MFGTVVLRIWRFSPSLVTRLRAVCLVLYACCVCVCSIIATPPPRTRKHAIGVVGVVYNTYDIVCINVCKRVMRANTLKPIRRRLLILIKTLAVYWAVKWTWCCFFSSTVRSFAVHYWHFPDMLWLAECSQICRNVHTACCCESRNYSQHEQ